MKKLNEKSKGEQFFLLVMMLVALLGVLCLTGCGGDSSCVTPKCATEKDGNAETGQFSVSACQVPGIAGCFGCSTGCGSCLFARSCKFVDATIEKPASLGDNEESYNYSFKACDTRYYGGSCLGCGSCGGCLGWFGCDSVLNCGSTEKTYYTACVSVDEGKDNGFKGFVIGRSGDESGSEKAIGCGNNGCAGCVDSNYGIFTMIYWLEESLGIN